MRPSALLAAALLGMTSALPAAAFDLPELMARLAQRKSGEATFTEQRFVRALDAPLEASGTLTFAAPDRFERRTLKPRPESLKVEGNTVTMTRGGRSRAMALDATPEAAAAVDAVRGTLAGDARLLERRYTTRLEGTADRWLLELTPREAGALQRLRITGYGDDVRVVETELTGGDRAVMTIDPVRSPAR